MVLYYSSVLLFAGGYDSDESKQVGQTRNILCNMAWDNKKQKTTVSFSKGLS